MQPLKTPDVTLVQKLVAAVSALIAAGLAALQAFGVDLTTEQVTSIVGLWTALASVFVIADAIIRNGRARALTNAPKGLVNTEDETGA